MATALRPVSHDDRLSLVEHLTELRVRIVICLLAFLATTALCLAENQRVLDILNKPLEQTVHAGTKDPIMQGARWDQLVSEWMLSDAALQRQAAGSVDDTSLRAAMLAHAEQAERISKLVPPIQKRKPVTLGVSEPFMQTLKI